MIKSYKFGMDRCIEPKNSFPDASWRLDNTMKAHDNEILIDVSILNIEGNSFKQIYVESQGNIDKIKKKIFDIVETRGKLHNPITGTGGILYGKVVEIGDNYINKYNIKVGDNIISLTSLALTPLKIKEITNVDINNGQVKIEGKAILFSYSPLIKAPNDLPLNLLMAVLDEAGAAMQSYNLAKKNSNILILGASGEIGLMCAYAIREKIGKNGRIVGIRSIQGDKQFRNETTDIYDEVYYEDILKPIETFEKINSIEEEFDLIINCVNIAGSEMLCILCTKEGGIIYLATLDCNYKTMCLSVEGIAKDINILAYKGYSKNHASFTIKMLRGNPNLVKLLENRLIKNYQIDSLSNNLSINSNIESNILKDINLDEYIFESKEMKKVLDNAFKVANYECTVLITGESGVGKEIIAKVIHKSSNKSSMSCIKINCGSISKNLLESELFGYEKGAFTGADKNGKLGFFEVANGGTLFLDEIGELSLDLQVKLLRAIQEKEIYRIGGTTPIHVDVRLLAATNKDLKTLVEEGKFREDLYYRLNVYPITIPPLRNRRIDIIPLVKHFTKKYNRKFNLDKEFDKNALEYLNNYDWPGNIRELENFIQRALISSDNKKITIIDAAKILQGVIKLDDKPSMDFEHKTYDEIISATEYEVLKKAKDKYKTTRNIAKALKLSQSTLVRKLNKYNL